MKKVLKFVEETNASFKIVDAKMIETKDWSEVYDQYGNQQEDEIQNIESPMIEYHNGQNWQTDVIDDGTYPHPKFQYTDTDTEKEILAELETADFGDYERGISIATTENYVFTKSQWGHHYGIDVQYA